MSDELIVAAPVVTHVNNEEQVVIQVDQLQKAEVHLATPSEEEIRSVDGVFTQQRKSHDGAGAILGVTTGMLVLYDMAVDRFTTHEEEKEQPRRKERPEGE